MYRVNVGDVDGFLVSLVLRKLHALNNHIRQVGGETGDNNVTVFVIYAVPAISGEHIRDIPRVCNPVVEDLAAFKIIVIYADAVEVDSAVIGADANADRVRLREVVAGRVLYYARHNAVDIDVHEPVLAPLFYDERDADVLVLLVLH